MQMKSENFAIFVVNLFGRQLITLIKGQLALLEELKKNTSGAQKCNLCITMYSGVVVGFEAINHFECNENAEGFPKVAHSL